MLFAFLFGWAIGAWLVVICTALIWAERVRIYRRLPICAACGYSMDGLEETACCPECAGVIRTRKAVTGTPPDSPAIFWAWIIPSVFGVAGAILISIWFAVGGLSSLLLLITLVVVFAALSVLVRTMVRWLPPAAILRMAIFGALAIVLATLWFIAIARAQRMTHDLNLLILMAVLIWPFCGYGISLAILTVPAEDWFREVLVRSRSVERLRD
jgi:hypothetical protein